MLISTNLKYSIIFQEKWTKADPWIKIKPEKHIYLKSESNCRDRTFYECFISSISYNDLANISNICLPESLLSLRASGTDVDDMPKCNSTEENAEAFWEIFDEFENVDCAKLCSILEYSGKIEYWDPKSDSETPNTTFAITIRFAYPATLKVFEEYLIYDIIGMVGSVGGTLGMFIGFSFIDVVSRVFSFLRQKTRTY